MELNKEWKQDTAVINFHAKVLKGFKICTKVKQVLKCCKSFFYGTAGKVQCYGRGCTSTDFFGGLSD
jgi:hypothetical protein